MAVERADNPGLFFLQGGGQTGALIRAIDWRSNPLGAPQQWPRSLKAVVGLMLNCKFPMVVVWGHQLTFLYNDGYAELLGAKHPAALGGRFAEVWAEIWPDILPLVERALAGESTYHENLPLTVRRNGYDEPAWFTFSYSPAFDDEGRIGGMFCACTETTAQVLAERHRQQELGRLRAMFEQAPGLIALLRGPRHVFELANDAYLQLIGRRDVLGRAAVDALPEVADQRFVELLDQVYGSGKPYVGHGMRLMIERQRGRLDERFVDFVFQPMFDAAGAVSGIFVEGSDVTDRVRALHELRASDRRKDEFLAMLAHELRNPLAPICSAADLLEAREHDPAVVRQAGAVIRRQSRHMTRLVDDLLDVSRVTRGAITLERQPQAVADIVAAAVEQVRGDIDAHRHRLMIRDRAPAATVFGDRTRLVQVLANLLSNAAKFTPAGGSIELAIEPAGDHVVMAVRDNGIGIEADMLAHVFDLFTQADCGADRSRGGLGLGLALVRRLVELHGGEVEARSGGAGQGSEFVVRLPRLAQPAVREEPSPAAAAEAPRAARRVLVVDDNLDAAESLALLLETRGHAVQVAGNAAEALARARDARFDALLLDIGLPDMDGYALAAELRALPSSRDALLVALTGYGQDSDRARSAAAGFDHHLVKPVDLERLLALVEGAR